MEGIITVKTNGGINNLAAGNGDYISAKLYSQEAKDRNSDGRFTANYENKPFPGSIKYFSPVFDAQRREWSWSGSGAEFKDIVSKLRLKYPKGHHRAGEIIVPGDVNSHKKDFLDPIFHHPDLISKVSIKSGAGTLNLAIPLEAFIYYSNKGLRDVIDETNNDEKRINPLLRQSARIVMSNPEKVSAKKRVKTDYFLAAMGVISKNQRNTDRLRMFAELFNIPGLSRRSDSNDLVHILTDYVKEYGDKVQKGSGYESLNEALVAHDKMDDTELIHRYALKIAKKNGHIRPKAKGFNLLGVDIEGPKGMDEIYRYFAHGGEEATDRFIKLLTKMRDLGEID